MLTILGWLFIGFFVASIGQALRLEKEPDTLDGTVLIGICGAFIGGLIGGSPFRPGQGNAGFVISLALAVLGSLVVLSIYNLALGLNFAGFLSVWAFIKDRRPLARNFQTAKRSAVAPNPQDIGSAVSSLHERRPASELFRIPVKVHSLLCELFRYGPKPS